MGMWFFGSKVMNYYNKKLCNYTIESACKDLIRRLRNALNNTNIRYIGNDQFKIDGNTINENDLVNGLLDGSIIIEDELLDIILF